MRKEKKPAVSKLELTTKVISFITAVANLAYWLVQHLPS
jgi:hypothetical protein